MGKTIRDEDLRLNIIVNGNAGRKAIADLESTCQDAKIKLESLIAAQKKLESQGKTNTPVYKKLTAEVDKQSVALVKQREQLQSLIRQQSLEKMTLSELMQHHKMTMSVFKNTEPGTEQWKKLRLELQQVDARIKILKTAAKDSGSVVSRFAGKISSYFGAITAGLASMSFVLMGFKKARMSFLEYDEALTDAQKTTNTTKTEIREISDEISKIDTRTSQNKLLDIVRIAGKLGIDGVQNLEAFVRAGDKIGVALERDLGDNTEAAIQQIGKLVDIFHLKEQFGIEQSMLKVGSAINELGMASTAAEGYIVEFAKRAAGTAPNVDISIQSVLGLGATLDKFGQQAETSGTAYGQVITAMYKRTEVFAKIAQMSLVNFRELMGQDMNEAFVRVLEGMGKSGNGMQTIVNALNSMKLDGQRAQMVLGTLAKNTDELRRQQDLANNAFEDGTSIINEFTTKNESATAIYEKQKKALTDQAVLLGETLNPVLTSATSVSVVFLKCLTSLVQFFYQTKGAIIPLVASVVTYKTAVFLATRGLTLWRVAHIAFIRTTRDATTATRIFNNVIKQGVIGWIATAFSVAAAAVALFRGELFSAHKEIKNLSADAAIEIDNEKRKLNELKQSASNAAAGSIERAEAIKIINEKYSDYLPNLLTDKNSNEDIAIAIRSVNTELEKNINLKFRQQDQERILNDRNSAIKKSITDFEGLISATTGKDVTTDQHRILTASVMDYIQVMDKEEVTIVNTNKAYIDLNNTIARLGGVTYRPVSTWDDVFSFNKSVANIRKSLREAREETKDLDILYGKIPTVDTKSDPEPKLKLNLNPTSDDGKKWSLDKDKDFLAARLKLKEQYQQGEIMSEEEFNMKLRELEIKTLEDRLSSLSRHDTERLQLEEQLVDKRLEQKKAERTQLDDLNKLLQLSETDNIKRENADYEQKKKKYAGNVAALEAIEKSHLQNLTKIRLNEFDKRLKQEVEQYELDAKILKNRHKQELLDFNGSSASRKLLRQEQMAEESRLEADHLTKMAAQLKTLIDTGMFDGLQIDMNQLSEEEKQDLLKRFEEIKAAFLGLQTTISDPQYSFEGQGGDLLGMSQDDWKILFENLAAGKFGVEEMIATTKALISAFATYDKFMTAKENASLKRDKKNNDKKKKELQKRLDSGLISQDAYNAQTEQMDAEYEAKEEELQIKQAKRQKALGISEAIINTAIGITSALKLGAIIGPILAAMIGAMGAAQVAMIAATPILTGAEEGGYVVERQQDGEKYNARYSPNKRGFISSPTVLVSENGKEYVVPSDAMDNPTLIPVLNTIEAARRQGTLGSFDFNAVYRQQPKIQGLANGGAFSSSVSAPAANLETNYSYNKKELMQIVDLLIKLNEKSDNPIPAILTMTGEHGFIKTYNKYLGLKRNGQLG